MDEKNSNNQDKPLLDDKELKKLEAAAQSHAVLRYLKHQDSMRFNIGDVLIKQHLSYGRHGSDERSWVTVNVSSVSGAPKKFMYVYENEQGVGYLKQLQANGKGFAKHIICMADVDPGWQRFIVDPDYQDHILIGEGEFKYNQAFKEDRKRRNEIHKKNKQLLANVSTWAKANEVLKDLNKGDKFWMGYDLYSATEHVYEVIEPVKFQAIDKMTGTWNIPKSDGTTNLQGTIGVKEVGASWDRKFTTDDIVRMKIFLVKPFSYENEP